MKPSLSVVVPCRNSESTIAGTLASLAAQSLPDLEIVVVDDGSEDATREVVEGLDVTGLRLLSHDPRGVCAARNAGAELAGGEFLAFLDSDDVALEGWASTLLSGFEDGIGLSFVGARVIRHGDEKVPERVRLPVALGPAFGRHEGLFLAGAFACRRSLFESAGGYDESLEYGENMELGLRLVEECEALGMAAATHGSPLFEYHRSPPRQHSRRDLERRRDAARRILEKHHRRVAADPNLRGNLLAVAGVSAGRLGDWKAARRDLFRALLYGRSPVKNAMRLAAAWMPRLASSHWQMPLEADRG